MPETTKTFANMEILQGADFEMIITLDTPTKIYDANGNLDSTYGSAGKGYMLTICKDFTGSTDFGGRQNGNGTASSPYRTEVTEVDQTSIGKLTATDSNGIATGSEHTITINLYAQWTETLDDGFDGFWELVERDRSKTPDAYARIAQGEIYVSKSASRYASTETLTS